ncbi:MAG: YihY/virulence factor BrkB family protein [Lentisphaeria bacterium]|nr:YihY/virulence factor BrkB family protein [Lentisphaeria bacterium]
MKRILTYVGRLLYFIFHGFKNDRCGRQAASLTLATFFAFIPALALVLSVTKELAFDADIIAWTRTQASVYPESIQSLIENLITLVTETNFLALGIIGIVFLFGTVFKLIRLIESFFNEIWMVKEERSMLSRYLHYFFVMTLLPLTMLALIFINMIFSSRYLLAAIELATDDKIYIHRLISLASVVMMILLFAFLYFFLPNTKVNKRSALTAATLVGVMFVILQKLILNFLFFISERNSIYGAFAFFPVLIYTINVGWLLVLAGAQICRADQNLELLSKGQLETISKGNESSK